MLRDRFLQIGRDKSFDQDGPGGVRLRQNATLKEGLGPVIGDKRSNLVAREKAHLIVRRSDRHTHAIAVGIGSQDEVSLASLRQFYSQFESLGVFRVR